MAKKGNKKTENESQEFGDIVHNHDLVKRTLMASAYPALIKSVVKDGDTFFEGFLPGFEFAQIEDVEDENEIVEYLQDMLDDEVEELVVFGKSLPYVEEDEQLMEKYPDYKIVLLDINVYATKEELNYYDACSHNCSECAGGCGEDEFYDDEFYEDYDDEDDCDCGCGHHHHHEHDHHCHHYHHHYHFEDECDDDCCCEDDDCCDDDCDDSCGCNDNCDCDDDCDCEGHHHNKETCNCKNDESVNKAKTKNEKTSATKKETKIKSSGGNKKTASKSNPKAKNKKGN